MCKGLILAFHYLFRSHLSKMTINGLRSQEVWQRAVDNNSARKLFPPQI